MPAFSRKPSPFLSTSASRGRGWGRDWRSGESRDWRLAPSTGSWSPLSQTVVAMSGDMSAHPSWSVAASSGQTLKVLLNLPQCPGITARPPTPSSQHTTKSCPATEPISLRMGNHVGDEAPAHTWNSVLRITFLPPTGHFTVCQVLPGVRPPGEHRPF